MVSLLTILPLLFCFVNVCTRLTRSKYFALIHCFSFSIDIFFACMLTAKALALTETAAMAKFLGHSYKSKVATVSNTPQPYQCSFFLTKALHEGESHIPAQPTSPRAQWTQEKISLHRPDIELRFSGHPACSPNQETKWY